MDLKNKSKQIRKDVIRVAVKNNKGHIASSLSIVEILTVLYYEIMKPEDRFILSKGHGCYSLYAILADKGLIPKNVWENFELEGCVSRHLKYSLLASTGSLGQGLSIACGIAYAKKLKNESGRVFCVVGDGEMQEGQIWEALIFAGHNNLDNLTVILDNNRLQAMDFTDKINSYLNFINENFFNVLGFKFIYCDEGHYIPDLLSSLKKKDKCPIFLEINTIKGKGLKCAENVPKFHYRVPTSKELLSKKGVSYGK